jgi:hypothetical protein
MRRPFAREDQPTTELRLIVGASSERLDDIEGRAGGGDQPQAAAGPRTMKSRPTILKSGDRNAQLR